MAGKGTIWAILGALGILGLMGFAGAAGAAGPRRRNGKPPTKVGEGRKAKQWGATTGTPGPGGSAAPDVFDHDGPGVFIDADCSVVVEGARFWPEPADPGRPGWCGVINMQELTTMSEDVNLDCSVLNIVDSMVVGEDVTTTDPIDVAAELLRQISPLCADVDPALWGDGLFDWYNDLVDRLTDYIPRTLEYWGNGIEFGPSPQGEG